MSDKFIKVADYTKFPGPRFIHLGHNSGEKFRDEYLIPYLENNENDIGIDLDGVFGYGSSFLEEVFGGLVRKNVSPEKIDMLLQHIKSDDEPDLISEIREYVLEQRSALPKNE